MTSKELRLARLQMQTHQLIADVAVESDARRREIRRALGETLDSLIQDMDEAERADMFARLEARASASQRRLLQRHPDRPAFVSAETAPETAGPAREPVRPGQPRPAANGPDRPARAADDAAAGSA